MEQEQSGRVQGKAVYDVPLDKADAILDEIKKSATVRRESVVEDSKAPEGRLAIASLQVAITTFDPLVPRDEGFGSQLRSGMSIALRGLFMSLTFILAAVVFLLPWALIAWVVWRLVRQMRGAQPEPVAEGPTGSEPPAAGA
jgi:hypothetical protein